jgi:hypothetical protein
MKKTLKKTSNLKKVRQIVTMAHLIRRESLEIQKNIGLLESKWAMKLKSKRRNHMKMKILFPQKSTRF